MVSVDGQSKACQHDLSPGDAEPWWRYTAGGGGCVPSGGGGCVPSGGVSSGSGGGGCMFTRFYFLCGLRLWLLWRPMFTCSVFSLIFGDPDFFFKKKIYNSYLPAKIPEALCPVDKPRHVHPQLCRAGEEAGVPACCLFPPLFRNSLFF